MENQWIARLIERSIDLGDSLPSDLLSDIVRVARIALEQPEYQFRWPELKVIAEYIDDSSSGDEYVAALVGAADICQFDFASVFVIRHGNAINFRKRVCTTMPDSWLENYDARRYKFTDPVTLKALGGATRLLFSDIKLTSPMAESFWKDAEKYGIGRNGILFTYDLGMGIKIGMSLVSGDTEEVVADRYEKYGNDLEVFGAIAARSFADSFGLFHVDQTDLTVDDLRFLKALMNSASPVDAASLMEDNKMRAVQDSICKRLGVSTVYQALSIVAREGWFDDLPFDGEEVLKPSPLKLERGRGHSVKKDTPVSFESDDEVILRLMSQDGKTESK